MRKDNVKIKYYKGRGYMNEIDGPTRRLTTFKINVIYWNCYGCAWILLWV